VKSIYQKCSSWFTVIEVLYHNNSEPLVSINCTVGTVSGAEMDSVMISWTGILHNENHIIGRTYIIKPRKKFPSLKFIAGTQKFGCFTTVTRLKGSN